jgi:hypothetical protein
MSRPDEHELLYVAPPVRVSLVVLVAVGLYLLVSTNFESEIAWLPLSVVFCTLTYLRIRAGWLRDGPGQDGR